MKSKKVIFTGQHEFTKKKSWLNILIVFCGVLTGFVYNSKAEGDVYPDFSNVCCSLWWPYCQGPECTNKT